MIIAAFGSENNKIEFESKIDKLKHTIIWFSQNQAVPDADVYFNFEHTSWEIFTSVNSNKLVFTNAVHFLNKDFPNHFIRANFWNGFISNPSIEIAENTEYKHKTEEVLNNLSIPYLWAPDVVGLISARVTSMIINEAYFGLEDKISSKKDIDIAMKLGTNYPYGPFEWSEKIGLHNIYYLLKKLSLQNTKYSIAPLLEKEVNLL